METLEQKIQRVLRDSVEIVSYDPAWPESFEQEKRHLLDCLPEDLIVRIEHFGSTAIPGMAAKPIVDMLVEVTSLERTKAEIVPVLEGQGCDYFWRPTMFEDPPFYAWFIRRNSAGIRTHHIHMVEADSVLWERLIFRDYLLTHPEFAEEYSRIKMALAEEFPGDRIAYTKGKSEFVERITRQALRDDAEL